MLFISMTQWTYYENNNEFRIVEYIRNYEIVNLFLEYFYFNPYVVRSSAMLHHVISIILPHTFVLLQHENVPIIRTFTRLACITITTNLPLDMIKTFHKNNILKLLFFIYYFLVRIIMPFPFFYDILTGYYLYITPIENIPTSLFLSIGAIVSYGLNIFWFYKICRIARKLIA